MITQGYGLGMVEPNPFDEVLPNGIFFDAQQRLLETLMVEKSFAPLPVPPASRIASLLAHGVPIRRHK
jgi:hypothetical protein